MLTFVAKIDLVMAIVIDDVQVIFVKLRIGMITNVINNSLKTFEKCILLSNTLRPRYN